MKPVQIVAIATPKGLQLELHVKPLRHGDPKADEGTFTDTVYVPDDIHAIMLANETAREEMREAFQQIFDKGRAEQAFYGRQR